MNLTPKFLSFSGPFPGVVTWIAIQAFLCYNLDVLNDFDRVSRRRYGKEKVRTIKTYYLIDYENVHGDGLAGCGDLGKKDRIIIFFTKNAKSIDMSEIADHGDARLKMIEVSAGKQSADMHIGSYLGYLAGKKGKNCNVVIVSRDTDYDNVIKFWKKKTGIAASRAQQIGKKCAPGNTANHKPTAPKKAPKKNSGARKAKLNQETMQAMRSAGFNAQTANKVAQIATGHYGSEHFMSDVHNTLKEKYKDYLKMYEVVKPILSKYENTAAGGAHTQAAASKEKNEMNTNIMRILSKEGYSSDIASSAASIVVKNLGIKNRKQQIYRSIISKYGRNEGLTIYNHIKKHI